MVTLTRLSDGYEILFERRHMYSQITFDGVGLQQDPNDALVIADLLWRVRPRLSACRKAR